jgi:hypothetical protein
MTLPQAFDLFEYWKAAPPEHELVAMLATVYTTWRPAEQKRMTVEEKWAAGALNPAQMMGAMDLAVVKVNEQPPGIGPWPWAVH